jgi:short-subunit dehydrogenase
MKLMKDKVIVITGASSGIGAELAHQAGRAGAKLVLAARDEDRLLDIAEKYPGSLAVPTNVTVEAACKNLVEETINQFGRIDVLVNNAGLSMFAIFDQIQDLGVFRQVMDVNLFGSVYPTYFALPYLKESKGLIVAVSSLAGKTGVPTRTVYSASKHAVQGFFDSLRVELMGTGVDVCVVSPGFVQTEMRERALGADGKPLVQSHLEESGVMPVEECVRLIMDAIEKRKREVVMGGFRIKLGMWLKLIAPKIVDNMARRAIRDGRS